MSDFLARLAARAIGTGATLVPRLPALFEPVAEAAPAWWPDAGIESSVSHDPTPASPATAVTHTEPKRATSEHRVTAVAQPRSPAVAATPPSRRIPHAEPQPGEASPWIAVARHPLNHDAATPAAAVRGGESRVAERASPPPVRVVQPSSVRAVHLENSRIPVVPAQAGTHFGFRNGNLDPGLRRDGGHDVGHSKRPAAPSPAAANGTHAAHAITPDTVVQVSIGRIEVRAAPAARTSAPRAEGPRPGRIDEYLRQRARRDAP